MIGENILWTILVGFAPEQIWNEGRSILATWPIFNDSFVAIKFNTFHSELNE